MNNEELTFVFCTQCGAKNEAGANFCTSCGSKLVKPASEPANTAGETELAKEETVTEGMMQESVTETSEAVPEDTEATKSNDEEAVEEIPKETIEESLEEAVHTEVESESKDADKDEPAPAPIIIPPAIPIIEESVCETSPTIIKESEPKEPQKGSETISTPAPVVTKISKKEAKLEKKLEEAKKQAQEEARKKAEKEAEKAKKAEEKAEKAAAKARLAEEKAKKAEKKSEEKAKNSEKRISSESPQNNSYYYTSNNESDATQIIEKPKKKSKQNFFLKLLSFLLSILLLLSLAVAVPITLLNLFLTDRNINIIVDRTITDLDLEKIRISTESGTKSLSVALYDVTKEIEGLDHITKEQIDDELLEDFVKQFLSDTLTQLGTSLEEGETMLGWTPEQLYDFIYDNKKTIEQLAKDAGYEGMIKIKEQKDTLIANIEEKIDKDGITASAFITDSSDAAEFERYLTAAQALFSEYALYFAWGLVAFIIMLIIFTNIGYFGAFCRACGFPAFIIGGLYFLLGLAVTPILSLVEIPIPILAVAIDFTAGFIAALLMDICVIVLATGLGLIIISFIADAIKRKTENKKMQSSRKLTIT